MQHLLGTDESGRDLLSRMIYGARTSLLGPLLVVTLAASAGTAIALLAAWRGGFVNGAVASGIDILFGFPGAAAGGRGGRRVRARADRAGDRARDRLHPLHRPRRARRGTARAPPSLRGGAAGRRLLGPADRARPSAAEPRAGDRSAGDDRVRLRHDRPGGDLIPGPRRAAAHVRLGPDDRAGRDRGPGRQPVAGDLPGPGARTDGRVRHSARAPHQRRRGAAAWPGADTGPPR